MAAASRPQKRSAWTLLVQGDGQQRERAGPACELDLARGELVPRHVVAEGPGDVAGQPEPAELVLLGEGVLPEGPQRLLQRGRPCGVAPGHEEGEPVEQQIAGAGGGGPPVGGEDRLGDLARIAAAHQAVGGERRGERVEVGLARERRVERLQPLGGLEQQRGSVAAARRGERDLRVQQLRSRALELVQRSRLRHREQPLRRVGRTGLVLALRGGKRAPRPARRVGRQLGSALVKRGPRRQAAPRPRAPGRALQLGGDLLVEPGRRLGAVPGAAIGIGVGVRGLREGLVDAPADLRRGRSVHRGPHQRMAEAHLGAELDQLRVGGRGARACVDPQRGGRLPQQERITHRLGRRDQEQKPRRRRQVRQALLEPLLDAAGQRRPAVQPEPARQLGGCAAARQLQQRQRVAVRLGHDPIADALVERTRHHGLQQCVRITVLQPADEKFREPLEMRLAGRLAHGEDQPDRLGPQTARHERERLRRRPVEPLRIVHDADQRPVLRRVGQQAQGRQADEEPIRGVAVTQPERRAQRVALRAGKALEAIHERRAELMQPGERELHLRLDARCLGDAAP